MRFRVWYAVAILVVLAGASLAWMGLSGPTPLSRAAFDDAYKTPLAPRPPEQVFHLGHSLVGRDMPAMLSQLGGHAQNSQLGWGSPLRQHWEPDEPVSGFEVENNHDRYRDAHDAAGSGEYDAFVVTEALGYTSRWPWQRTHSYLRKWAVKVWNANPETRVYLYATWRELDREGDWLDLIDAEFDSYWEGAMLRHTLAYGDVTGPIHVIPGGLVMAAVARAAEAGEDLGPITSRRDLFSDEIHFNDYGAYLMALTHFAVLYGTSPVGLPHTLTKADGAPADDVGAAAARRLQEIVWDVVTGYPPAGIAGD